MADLTITYVGMSDQQLESTDETDVEISVANTTGQSIVLTDLRCERDWGPEGMTIDFRTPQNPTYANPHTTDLRGLNLVIAPNSALSVIVGVRTQEHYPPGEETFEVQVGYEFVQPTGPIQGDITITVSPD